MSPQVSGATMTSPGPVKIDSDIWKFSISVSECDRRRNVSVASYLATREELLHAELQLALDLNGGVHSHHATRLCLHLGARLQTQV